MWTEHASKYGVREAEGGAKKHASYGGLGNGRPPWLVGGLESFYELGSSSLWYLKGNCVYIARLVRVPTLGSALVCCIPTRSARSHSRWNTCM